MPLDAAGAILLIIDGKVASKILKAMKYAPNENTIAKALNELLNNETYYRKLHNNSLEAKQIYCWENEEQVLLNIYKSLFHD